MPLSYVLDTNVLLHDPKSIFVFEEHQVIIPLAVLREIDKFKRDSTELGANARRVSRYLDKLSTRGDIKEGVLLEGGGTLRVALVRPLAEETVDDSIIRCAANIQGEVTLVTRDTNMRLLAKCAGVRAEDYRHDRVPNLSGQYRGWREVLCSNNEIDTLSALLRSESPAIKRRTFLANVDLNPNEGVNLLGSSRSVLVRVDGEGVIREVKSESASSVTPKSREQTFAMSALLDPSIPLVTLSGIAGTGKTLLALAAGLQQMPSMYSKMMVSRPVVPMGKGIGFLPGTLAEKMDPWMGPIYDNLDFLINSKKKRKESKPWDALIHQGLLEVEALAFIRGRSIPELFMIIDEAQNLTPHEVKTVLTRAGKGTKIILTGDPNQIDNPYVDSQSNGLSYAIEKFKGSKLAAHVTLVKGERSDLAEEAALIL